MLMAGFVTSVIIRVGSVTSTSLRTNCGDMRPLSGPIWPLSSGTLPGQISTIIGSAAAADHATINETTTAAGDSIDCMVKFPGMISDCAHWLFGYWSAASHQAPCETRREFV